MKFETFETLLVLLLFAVPGAVFVYGYSRSFNPSDRVRVIQEQFPADLIFLYLIASTIINSIILVGVFLLLSIFETTTGNSQVLSWFFGPFTDVLTANAGVLLVRAAIAFVCFFGIIVLAFIAGKYWAKHHPPAVPRWCKDLLAQQATALSKNELARIKVELVDDQFEGEWHGFRLLSGKQMSFELAIRQTGRDQIIWIPSSLIVELEVKASHSTVKLRLRERSTEGKTVQALEEPLNV